MRVAVWCAVVIGCFAALAGIAGAGENPATPLVEAGFTDAPAFVDDGDARSLQEAIRQSLAWFAGQPPERQIAFGRRVLTVAEQQQALRRMLELLADDPPADVLEARVNAEFDLLKERRPR